MMMVSEITEPVANKQLALEDKAHQLEAMPVEERVTHWRALEPEEKAAVLSFFHAEPRRAIFDQCNEEELLDIGLQLTGSELAEIFEELPEETLFQIVKRLDTERKEQYQSLMRFESHQVGRYLSEDVYTLPVNTSVFRARRLLQGQSYGYLNHCYLVSRNNRFVGAVALLGLSQSDGIGSLRHLIDESIKPIVADTEIDEAITQLELSGYAALPVVDNQGVLLGVFNMAKAMHAQRETAEALLLATAGMDEDEDLFAPIRTVIKDRALWLGINLITAVLASTFIGLFEASLAEIVALAVLMPIVASMGGITGSQTLAMIIRRMALNQITDENRHLILRREVMVGFVNGLLWAVLGGLLALTWFGDARVGIALAIGLFVNICVAAWCGMSVPLMLKRLGIDPAISGSVILTTITDIVGFVSFLGSATLIMWQLS
ncbi:MAG: magnesium transporter [Gammaproteobacteria bacterium]|nr:MAG: magnesium transporter [Gammaproteobacteria bacterium]